MTEQTKAQRLAEIVEKQALAWREGSDAHKERIETAAELRRLDAENAELRSMAKQLAIWQQTGERLVKNPGIGFTLGVWWAERPWRGRFKADQIEETESLVIRAMAEQAERDAALCDAVKAKSRHHLFRSGAAICGSEIRANAPKDTP